ncbi:venom allergen 2-like [Temnothorax nylanderi]|uniref:venom allergen 2-like n=1 Tax=Temnothorax nylanderi TaxID=102681 RepID=UPI003A85C7B9
MKAILLATCLLVTVVHAVDYEEIKGVDQDLDECRTSYVKTCVKTSPDYGSNSTELVEINAWYCTLVKRGVIDENDVFIEENIFPYCENITVNADYCKTIVSKCVEKANLLDSTSNVQKSLSVVKCNLESGLVDLIPKPEGENA